VFPPDLFAAPSKRRNTKFWRFLGPTFLGRKAFILVVMGFLAADDDEFSPNLTKSLAREPSNKIPKDSQKKARYPFTTKSSFLFDQESIGLCQAVNQNTLGNVQKISLYSRSDIVSNPQHEYWQWGAAGTSPSSSSSASSVSSSSKMPLDGRRGWVSVCVLWGVFFREGDRERRGRESRLVGHEKKGDLDKK